MPNNHSSVRDQNIHTVLSQIINHPEISRAEISKKANLNKATVSEIVRNLIDEKYVLETGRGASSDVGGRKPILLKINKKAGVSVSFDVRYDQISYMTNYLNGETIDTNSIEMSIDSSNIISVIKNLVLDFQESITDIPFGLIGITISVHGIISDNKIVFTPYYDLFQLDLASELENELDVPVYLENEANLAALAEATLDTTHHNLITCSIHTGVGAGIIIDQELYRGFQGRSGEIGHTTLYPDGIQCPCGNEGCLEQYCSQNALLSFYQEAHQNSQLTLDDLIENFRKEDTTATKIIEKFAENLSIGMVNLMGAYGPEIIYINSQISREVPIIIDLIQEHLSETIYRGIPIKNSEVIGNSSLFGATVMNIQNFLEVNSLHLSLV